MKNVIVIGGGPAGMMAAIAAANAKNKVILLEKNEKLGKKIYITGKGRGNLTNGRDISEFFDYVVSNPKFLYSSFYGFSNQQTLSFLEKYGLKWKEERGSRIFPISDHASDITKALERALDELSVDIRLNTKVTGLIYDKVDNGKYIVSGVRTGSKEISADNVIIATGGLSYPSTGSTGDGFKFAKAVDIKLSDTYPALAPVNVAEDDIRSLQGLTLKNISLTIYSGDRKEFEEFGELLFTHFGVSGPLVLKASSLLAKKIGKEKLKGYIDLKPNVDESSLNKRLIQQINENPKKSYFNFYRQLLPRKINQVMIDRSGINSGKRFSDISKEERMRIVKLIKEFPFTITSSRGYKEAVITQGGIDVSEIDPSTMKAKNAEGLSFAGEVIDVDAYTGGFNMQIAFSTGYIAGSSIL